MIIRIANMIIRIPNIKIREMLFSPVVKGVTNYKLKTKNNPYNNKKAYYHPRTKTNTKTKVRSKCHKPRM